MSCTETHPSRGGRCVVDRPGHTWHKVETPSTYSATDVWPWGRPEDPPDAPARPSR